MAVSNVLVIGTKVPEAKDFGADFVPSFAEALSYLRNHQPAVLVFGADAGSSLDEFCNQAMQSSPNSIWIMDCQKVSPAQILRWSNSGQLYGLIDSLADSDLEVHLQSALEAHGETLQKAKLVELFEEQSLQLKRLSADLENRVLKRQKALRKSVRRQEVTKIRTHGFHKALLAIHRSSSVLNLEQSLNEALKGTIEIDWVRVRFEAQSSVSLRHLPHVLAIELSTPQARHRGEVLFAKPESQRFSSEERDFLHEISEALALAISRMQKLELAETLKAQWQATFDSIPHALCLATEDFEIVKMNSAFQQHSGAQTYTSLIGKNCFQVFFGKDFEPPPALEGPFNFRNSRRGPRETEHYEVSGQRMGLTHDNRSMQLILIRSITDEVRFERRILDSSKLAELGTIGSSIAHELNNPLGGMLSFLQLILMDLPKQDVLRPEIVEMESAVFRCRDIVQNLLSFARKQDLGDFVSVDLQDIIQRAIKLIELQSKSLGIRLEASIPSPTLVKASPNALSQAICNLLQNSVDSITERQSREPELIGEIRIELQQTDFLYQLNISDNGMGIPPEVQSQIFNPLFTTRDPNLHEGMGLTTAFTILSDHDGQLEILSQTGSGTTAVVSLPKPSPG